MERDIMAETAAKTPKPRKTTSKATSVDSNGAGAGTEESIRSHRNDAKSRFNAALEEARAGVAELGAGARERADNYRAEAITRGEDWTGEAKSKALELAREGKSKASEALTGLSRVVDENAPTIEQNLGPKYADYARSASRKLQDTASRLDERSIEQLGDDAREFVRKSPGTAVGLAALTGFLLARIFRR